MRSQRLKILDYLKLHPEGLNSYQATYVLNLGKQAPTRVKELKEAGYNIQSIPNKDRSVNWVMGLDSRATEPKPRLEDQYIFLPDGRAVLRESLEPRQEALI